LPKKETYRHRNNIREQYKLAQKAATYYLARTSDMAQS
jgi:hypothetical protein